MGRPRTHACPQGWYLHDAQYRQEKPELELAQLLHREIMDILEVSHLSPEVSRVGIELVLDDIWDRIAAAGISWADG